MKMFQDSIQVAVAQRCECIKGHWTVRLKKANFMLCEFHHNLKKNKANVSLWEKRWAHLFAVPYKTRGFLRSGSSVGTQAHGGEQRSPGPAVHGFPGMWGARGPREDEAHAACCAEMSCLLGSLLFSQQNPWKCGELASPGPLESPPCSLRIMGQWGLQSLPSKGAVCHSNEMYSGKCQAHSTLAFTPVMPRSVGKASTKCSVT